MNSPGRSKAPTSEGAKPSQESIDVLLNCLHRLEKSKTGPLLNLLYSVLVGVLSSCLTKRVTKAHGAFGVIIGLASFVYSRKLTQPMLKG